jgi:hydroxymethylpyrimidine/phosphomethylpyrimidine kinase
MREARLLLGTEIRTLAEQHAAARALGALGCRAVVVKGGHPVGDAGDEAVDVVWDGSATYELRAPRVDTPNHHGTGCTFSAAVTAALARGAGLREALDTAKAYVSRAVHGGASWRLGHGHGPLDHFGWASAHPATR